MRSEDSDLIAKLHNSAADQPAWLGFCDALRARLRARDAVVLLTSALNEEGDPQIFGRSPQPLALGSEQLRRMRFLRAYTNEDLPSPMPFRAIRTRVDDGGHAWLLVQRNDDDFAAMASALLSGLAPHLAIAARQYWARVQMQAYMRQMDHMALRLGLAWVLLGTDGAPCLASAGLGQSLVQGGRLRLRPLPDLQRMGAQPRAWQEGALQLLLCPLPEGGAALYVQGQEAPMQGEHLAQALADLMHIAPAEARFALQMAQGQTIAEAGTALNLSLETARHYSKQIYSKMGVSSQTAMMRRVQNSVLRLL